MVDVRLRLTEEQWNAVAQVAHDATQAYGQDIPITAVIMAACMKGLQAVRYEMQTDEKTTPRLRLVATNDRAGKPGTDIQAVSQSNISERSEG